MTQKEKGVPLELLNGVPVDLGVPHFEVLHSNLQNTTMHGARKYKAKTNSFQINS